MNSLLELSDLRTGVLLHLIGWFPSSPMSPFLLQRHIYCKQQQQQQQQLHGISKTINKMINK